MRSSKNRKIGISTAFTILLCGQLLLPALATAGIAEGKLAYEKYDIVTAIKEWEPEAKKGNSEAQYLLGTLYASTLGDTASYLEAIDWFLKAAQQGHILAQYELGKLYDRNGPKKDDKQAATWYRKAAEQNHVLAQLAIGDIYAKGRGAIQDFSQSATWYRKAAEQGNSSAQVNIGVMYAYGQGLPQNYAQAEEWFRKAGVQGNSTALQNLGVMYIQGIAVEGQDKVVGYVLLNLAYAEIKHLFALLPHQSAMQELSSAQLDEVESMTQAWKVGMPLPIKSKTWRQLTP